VVSAAPKREDERAGVVEVPLDDLKRLIVRVERRW